MPALYRAAIGPLHTERYLSFFEREDDTGRRLTGWNSAAALCTLNWMVFRQLWGAALVYVAALEGVALLVFVLGYQWLDLPLPVLAGLGLAWLFAASVLPGLYGDAIMHAEVRKKITKALSEAPTLAQARQRLEQQAPTRRRLMAFVAANAALAGLVAALWFALPGDGRAALERLRAGPAPGAPVAANAMPSASTPAVAAASTGAAAPAAAPDSPTPAPTAADSAATAAAAPATAAASLPAMPASDGAAAASEPAAPAPAPASLPAPASARSPAAVPASAPASGPSPVAAPAPAPGPAARASAPAPAQTPARASAALPAQAPASAAPRATSIAPVAQAPASAAAPAASAAAPAPRRAATASGNRRAPSAAAQAAPAPAPAPVLTAAAALPPLPEGGAAERQLFINVGLFADPANARRAHARLLANGLPSSTAQVTQRSTGRQLTRVRVGPFTATSDANAAVATIRAMELEAAAALQ